MVDNHARELSALRERIETMGSYLHIDDKRGKLAELGWAMKDGKDGYKLTKA